MSGTSFSLKKLLTSGLNMFDLLAWEAILTRIKEKCPFPFFSALSDNALWFGSYLLMYPPRLFYFQGCRVLIKVKQLCFQLQIVIVQNKLSFTTDTEDLVLRPK